MESKLTDDFLQSGFAANLLQRDIQNISKSQLLIAQSDIYITGREIKVSKQKSGLSDRWRTQLIRQLQHPDYDIAVGKGKFIATSNISKTLRFLDLKTINTKQGTRPGKNLKIYNRVVWGILYNQTLRAIKYHTEETIYDNVGDAIRYALNTKK